MASSSRSGLELPALTPLLDLPLGEVPELGRELAQEDGAVGEGHGVEVHEPGGAFGHAVRRARDNEPTVAVTEEHHVSQVLELDEVHHVGYVGVQTYRRRGEVHPLA